MPRVIASNSDCYDFCHICMPTVEEAVAEYGDIGYGPDGRGNCFGYNEDHPPYQETDYTCTKCGDALKTIDNY